MPNQTSHDDDPTGLTSEEMLTSEVRAKMTPEQVLTLFKQGNQRFISNNLRIRKFITEVSSTCQAQTPYAIVHSCIDSRVPVETVFDKRIGEIFSMRLAGSVISDDVIGGMEFATRVAGAKLILVMGHTRCGAVQGAAARAELGHLTGLVNKIREAEDRAVSTFGGPADPDNYAYVDHLAKEYVQLGISQILERSELLAEMEEKKEILVAGAMYDIATGKVDFFDTPASTPT